MSDFKKAISNIIDPDMRIGIVVTYKDTWIQGDKMLIQSDDTLILKVIDDPGGGGTPIDVTILQQYVDDCEAHAKDAETSAGASKLSAEEAAAVLVNIQAIVDALHVDLTNYYTKAEIDNIVQLLSNDIADLVANTYTQKEVDDLFVAFEAKLLAGSTLVTKDELDAAIVVSETSTDGKLAQYTSLVQTTNMLEQNDFNKFRYVDTVYHRGLLPYPYTAYEVYHIQDEGADVYSQTEGGIHRWIDLSPVTDLSEYDTIYETHKKILDAEIAANKHADAGDSAISTRLNEDYYTKQQADIRGSFAASAYVDVSGSIIASTGVASVMRLGTGCYNVILEDPLPNMNYKIFATALASTGTSPAPKGMNITVSTSKSSHDSFYVYFTEADGPFLVNAYFDVMVLP